MNKESRSDFMINKNNKNDYFNINFINKTKLMFLLLFIIIVSTFVSSVYAESGKITIGGNKPSLMDTVIITNDNWVDCISGIGYAIKYNGVILQTNSYYLDDNVKSIIKGINPKKIIIIGGPVAISNSIEEDLKNYCNNVERIGGKDRIETNGMVINMTNYNDNYIGVYVDGRNFKESAYIASSDYYYPVYTFIAVYDPDNTSRIYYKNGYVDIYYNKRYCGTFKKENILEVPGKIVVFIKSPINTTYCYDKNIALFGYKYINIDSNNNLGIFASKNNPTTVLLARYLNKPIVFDKNRSIPLFYENNPVDSSITTTVDILILKKTKEIYDNMENKDLLRALYEAKTQLWSMGIPVDKYNLPDSCLSEYVLTD